MTARTTRRPAAVRSRIAAVAAAAVAGVLLLSGCGDQTDDANGGGDTRTEGDAAPLFDRLPKDVQRAGEIKVGSDIAYAPVEFMNEDNDVAGIDPDLGKALGEQLGVPFRFANGTFDGLVTGLNTGRHDIIMSSMTDTRQRQQGRDEQGRKVGAGADFVDYFKAGSSILVKKGNPEGITSLDDLCGETVALQRGTANEDVVRQQNKKCQKPIEVLAFEKDTEALLQLKQGRAVADINDFPVAAYNAKTSGGGKDFEVVGDQINAAPYGIAVSKQDTRLRGAIRQALAAIMKNGEYQKVLEKWNVTNGALSEATVNAGK
ncbi:ABC transporter substrate-binding protein [Streptomyces sp. N2-109]|uniref:ABC transporter substrate-binding protein n=1 Tax=Streptomyces gossypii TaxID=2883101 RepID=A0ABT2JX36_9ACTN|nr:ABC transporter substrate-binding protein [Streptomyces gossypii]MCT2591819.1 ABC transporter substrate-binding protein [Streptomyces gossypii]